MTTQQQLAAGLTRLYLDHQQFGCGYRDYVALPGRIWVRLVLIATGESTRIGMAEYRAALATARTISRGERSRAARRLRKNARTFGHHGAVVTDALTALRGAA